MEDRDVLRDRDPLRRAVEFVEVGIEGTAVGVTKLLQRDLEVRSGLDKRQHPALEPDHPLGGHRCGAGPTEVRRGVRPAVRAGEVDELAHGQRRLQPLTRLLVEQLPAGIADRRERAKQMVHLRGPCSRGTSLILPGRP